MPTQQQFADILAAVRRGEPAAYSFTAEDGVFVRNFHAGERLILLGCGHIAQPLCQYAADLGFTVTAADDRPSFANAARFPEAAQVLCGAFPDMLRQLAVNERDYVAVITRGHRYDAQCLRILLSGPPPRYLGMIGSKRRAAELLRTLEQEGFPRQALERIHAPIGLPIHALTVKEIAISILAELIACRRRDVDRRAHGAVLTAEDSCLPVLAFLAEDPAPKVLLTVYDTSGSTPVKSGAMMALDINYRAVGTVGGGCGESAATQAAYRLIGTGGRTCVTVDLSNSAAEDEGMVCGGQMRILIEDVGQKNGG